MAGGSQAPAQEQPVQLELEPPVVNRPKDFMDGEDMEEEEVLADVDLEEEGVLRNPRSQGR